MAVLLLATRNMMNSHQGILMYCTIEGFIPVVGASGQRMQADLLIQHDGHALQSQQQAWLYWAGTVTNQLMSSQLT